MAFQVYNIHLIDGTLIKHYENYDLSLDKGIVHKYIKAKYSDILRIEFGLDGTVYVPKKNIMFIGTGNVEVTD